MHLESAHRGNQHHAVRNQPASTALDVEELFHADVGAKARFGDDIPTGTQLDSNLVGDDGRVARGNVGKRPGMNKSGAANQGLHQVRHQRVFQQDGHGTGHAQVLCCDRLAIPIRTDHDSAKALSKVGQAAGHHQNSHHFASHGDVPSRLTGTSVIFGAKTNDSIANGAVANVDHSVEQDSVGVDIQASELGALFRRQLRWLGSFDSQLLQTLEHPWRKLALGAQRLQQALIGHRVLMENARVNSRGEEVVGRTHGVDIARQVQVKVLHGHDLRIATARCATFNAKRGALRGLANTGEYLLANEVHRLAQANRGGGLSFAKGGRGNGSDVDVLGVRPVLEAVDHVQVDLGLILAVIVDVVFGKS